MDKRQIEEQIIKNYQDDEKMMILIYAQWCINHDLDPVELYQAAYPNQAKNNTLEEVLELTVPKEESEEISNHLLLNVLQLFGNDQLAFVVQSEIDKRSI